MKMFGLLGCLVLIIFLGYHSMHKVGKFLEEHPIKEEPVEDSQMEKEE